MSEQVWIERPPSVPSDLLEKVQIDLAQKGIDVINYQPGYEHLVGLVPFSTIDPELLVRIAEISGRGHHRVIAISLSRVTIPSKDVWSLIRAGASELLYLGDVRRLTNEIAARLARWVEVDRVIDSPLVLNNLVGRSRSWKRLLRQVIEMALFSDAPILITGESGTGKELIARLIHSLYSRKSRSDLVLLDCSTIVPELSGSEFFGHERGAYTGAVNSRDGAFALANGGTLFLDEVGELPLRLQAELLRAVQEKTYKRVGGNTWHRTEFRLVCATNRNLMEEQKAGNFRADLYYRIASCTCHLPPLRERREDLLSLVDHFLSQVWGERENASESLVDDVVRDYLLARDYPGNIRELKQLITRMLIRHVGPGPLTVGDIPEDERPDWDGSFPGWREDGFDKSVSKALAHGLGMKEIGREAEETAERIVIEQEGGNLQRAAQRLGVSDRTLQLRRASRNQDRPDSSNQLDSL